ncbi:Rrf2 family transcriptional regulator [Moraxella catarrhalis]|uniref:RrF2 family transcriptional regulator n=1 Tax=Moraxella catarrhalis TaxID=480 RepID=UPI00128B068E|nr:Rrf2 family transcriptional regulator [Moraxella catarrhalis]MPW51866.1 Rrf2 family transcriptional regulator [Moraxella catarrhalis]
MRLTQYSDFALRVLIYLATIPNNDELVRIDDIAKSYGISKNHLTKVIHQLSKLKVVDSARGKNGGIRLAMHPKNINVGNIVRQTESDFFVVACFADEPAQDDLMTDNLMTNDLRKIKTLDLSVGQPAMSCVISPACHLKQVFAEATKAFLQVLDSYTLADIISNADELRHCLSLYDG